ncbi:hypothetical protein FSP39_002042 [Pinctada imbricata]|uniref:Uncharacterized protein n=1 Tax=Pinctada imbricata TaxID=66713 RepID=A0AA88XT57_PINIB|nr:hypothetical protein FSP39_002042 [Pinctada imbricata]
MLETHMAINETINDCTDMDKCGYFKNCSNGQNYCVMERLEEQGSTVAYIRGCTNLSDFSVTPRTSPVADNSTKCSVYYQEDNQNIIVCISVCNSDLCNGPQFVFSGSNKYADTNVLTLVTFAIIRSLHPIII